MSWRSALISTVGVLVALPAAGADYFVSPQGNDGNDGSNGSPFATVAHAVGRATGGDTIYLERGGTYFASALNVGSLTVTAYGAGAPPVLTHSSVVELPDTWGMNMNVRTGPHAAEVLAVYVDGRFVPRARYPNTGFIRTDNADPDVIQAAALAARPGVAPGRWTGAQVRWRRWSWWWETRPITAHDAAGTLNLGADGRFQDPFSEVGSGFFIDGDLDELDAPGEWHWEAGTLYVYPPAWANPASMRVEVVTTTETGVAAGGATFSQVHFSRYGGPALELQAPSTVQDCIFSEIEDVAILYSWDAQPFTIERSIFRDVRNVAIAGWGNPDGTPGSRIERNLLQRIGMERGYGGSGSWHAAGVIIGAANGVEITLNRVVDTGYAGIILGSDGHRVFRNIFARTMSTLNDGAAVYANANASDIQENIILDTMGDLETSHPWWPLGHGIWPEYLSNFRDTIIVGNTIFGSNGYGVFLPNNFDCTVEDNLLVASRQAGLQLSGNSGDQQNNQIRNNVLASVTSPGGRIPRDENLTSWWLPPYAEPAPVGLLFGAGIDYGTMSNTTFVMVGGGAGLVRQDDTPIDSIAAWTGAEGWADATGTRQVDAAGTVLVFNDTEVQKDVALPSGDWTDLDGNAVGASVSLEPFAGALLLSASTPSAPPYIAASGIDWRLPEPTTTYLTLEPSLAVTRAGASVALGADDAIGELGLSEFSVTYSLQNQGGADLSLGAVSVSGAGAAVRVVSGPSTTVTPSQSSALVVAVTPDAEGAWSAQVSFDTNVPGLAVASWTISGTARDGAQPDAGVPSETPDSGTTTAPDGGTEAVDGGSDVPLQPAVQGGCSCALPGEGGANPWNLVLLFGLLLGAATAARYRRVPAPRARSAVRS